MLHVVIGGTKWRGHVHISMDQCHRFAVSFISLFWKRSRLVAHPVVVVRAERRRKAAATKSANGWGRRKFIGAFLLRGL
jgi:hypothetical protein